MGDVTAQLVEFTALIGDLVALARDETVRPRRSRSTSATW